MGTDGDSEGGENRLGPPTAHPNAFWMGMDGLLDGHGWARKAHPNAFWMG